MGFAMSIIEKRSAARDVDYVGEDGEMSATTSICVALVVALAVYVLGSAILLRDARVGVPQNHAPAEMSFLGP